VTCGFPDFAIWRRFTLQTAAKVLSDSPPLISHVVEFIAV
jgi:hypothetical protein